MRAGVENPDYRKRLEELGSLPAADAEMKPDYLAKFVPQEIEKFKKMLAEKK